MVTESSGAAGTLTRCFFISMREVLFWYFLHFGQCKACRKNFACWSLRFTAVSLDYVYPEVMLLACTNKATLPKQSAERGREQQEDGLRPREVPAEEMWLGFWGKLWTQPWSTQHGAVRVWSQTTPFWHGRTTCVDYPHTLARHFPGFFQPAVIRHSFLRLECYNSVPLHLHELFPPLAVSLIRTTLCMYTSCLLSYDYTITYTFLHPPLLQPRLSEGKCRLSHAHIHRSCFPETFPL